jgi:hypothetical protein
VGIFEDFVLLKDFFDRWRKSIRWSLMVGY